MGDIVSKEQLQGLEVGFFTNEGFEQLQRVGKMFAACDMVPKAYQGNVANCTIAVNMAYRLKADVLMVMQNLYNVHGNIGWSSKFLISTFNTCGRFSAIRYEWAGERWKNDWACRAFAYEKSTGDRVESPWITWQLVQAEGWDKKNGSKWKTMPEKMFMYRSAAWLVDTVAPELAMGLPTADQLEDSAIIDVKPIQEHSASVVNDLNVTLSDYVPGPKAKEAATTKFSYADLDEMIKQAATDEDANTIQAHIDALNKQDWQKELNRMLELRRAKMKL